MSDPPTVPCILGGQEVMPAESTSVGRTSPEADHTVFNFFGLPTELRELILVLALVDPDGVYLAKTTCKSPQHPRRRDFLLDLQEVDPWFRYGPRESREQGIVRASAADDRCYLHCPCTRSTDSCDEVPRCMSQRMYQLTPGLLGTCKQMRQEASPILYKDNHIVLANIDAVCDFLFLIGPSNRRLIQHIGIFSGYDEDRQWPPQARHACNFLAQLSGLKTFYFSPAGWKPVSNTSYAQRIWNLLAPFFVKYGRAQNRPDAALDVFRFRHPAWNKSTWRAYESDTGRLGEMPLEEQNELSALRATLTEECNRAKIEGHRFIEPIEEIYKAKDEVFEKLYLDCIPSLTDEERSRKRHFDNLEIEEEEADAGRQRRAWERATRTSLRPITDVSLTARDADENLVV